MIAHLGGDFGFTGGLGQNPRLVNGMRQRFFAIDVLAVLDGCHRNYRMIVIGRTDDNGVNTLFLVQHFAEVFIDFCLGKFLEGVGGVIPVHSSHNATMFSLVISFRSSPGLAADANAGNIQFVVGRSFAVQSQNATRYNHECGNGA